MATEARRRDHAAENQTWDYAHGVPIRELITIYLMPDIFALRPTAQPLMFYMTFYVGRSMAVAQVRHGYSHRLIGIFAHEDGPDPIDIVQMRSTRWGTRKSICDSFRSALRAAIIEKLKVDEDQIQYLDRIIFSVTKHELAANAAD